MRIYHNILFAALILLALSCGSTKSTAVATKSAEKSETKDTRTSERVTSMFIDASKERILGNSRQAMALYHQCLSLDPNHAPSMYELARLYRMQGGFIEALGFAEKAVKIDPDNKWYNLLLASLYEQSGQTTKAISVFENLLAQHPEDLEFMHRMAMLYMKESRFADAIRIYDKIERISGPDEDIILQKQKLYLMNNQPDKAIAETEKLTQMYPAESRYYALLAELYMDLDNYPKAIENLEKIRELDPGNPYIHITLAEYYFKTSRRDLAFEELKTGFMNPGLDIEIKLQAIYTYYTSEEIYGEYRNQVEELANVLEAVHPADIRPHMLKADLFIQAENYSEAREAFRKVISLDNSRFFIWETLLRIDAMLQDTLALRDESLEAIQLFPLQPLPYLFAGLAYYQLGDNNQALKMLNAGKDLVVDDNEMLAEFFMYMGDIYHKAEQHEASDKAYEQALAIDPDNPYVLNNYSYYLSLRKIRLEEAKKMSARSLEISPDNKHYLDTYGWILYQLGEYAEARTWIEKSVENNASEDAVVLEHLGDVLYKLGEVEQALMYWKKALDKGGDVSKFLEKKVKEGKLFE